LLLFSTFIALLFAWYIGAYFNFAFPLLYEFLDISSSIQLHAPQNIYKKDFSSTVSTQHFELFAQIVEGISLDANQVKNYLGQLTYGNAEQPVIDTFLHAKEIQHLYDVSVLLKTIKIASLTLAILGIALITAAKIITPIEIGKNKFRKRDVYFLVAPLFLLLGIALLLFGFESVFYQLHEWFFPAGHQWFFYYYESLMTPLMKAPDLFVYIGSLILFIFIIFQWAILCIVKKIEQRRLLLQTIRKRVFKNES